MPKLAIVINGKPGAGKDTLCDAVIRRGKARKISSIDPIVAIAKLGGWDGEKTAASRKLLSDIKRVFADFNDLPNRYVTQAYRDFMQSGDEFLFVHIRERDQIEAFRRGTYGNCLTLLIRRPGSGDSMGNDSDDGVYGMDYDAVFDNDQPQELAEMAFVAFIQQLGERYE